MKNSPLLSSSEMQLHLALAMVILGFEERVAKETRNLLELTQKISGLQQQYEELQAQREKDTDYLEQSIRHLYPALTLTVSEDGQVEIPAGILRQLQQVQQKQHPQFLLPEPPVTSSEERTPDENLHEVRVSPVHRTEEPSSLVTISDETHEEIDIDPRVKKVIAYVFAHPQATVLDWKTTVQHALQLPDPPKMKGHAVYKEVQRAYRLLESMHDGTVSHPSDALTAWYTQHFIEGERWGELKDIMLEWGVTSS